MRASKLLSFTSLAAMAGFAPAADNGGDEGAGQPPAGGDGGEGSGEGEGGEQAQPPATPTPPASPPAPAPAPAGDQASAADTVLASDALQLANQARAAEATRWNDVLSSDAGQANVANATFLLFHSTADAPTIVAQLKATPQAAAPASTIAATTPKIDVNGQGGAAAGAAGNDAADKAAGKGNGAAAADDPWATVQANNALTAGGQGGNLGITAR